MDPPATLSALNPRDMEKIASAATAVQANVVALRVAWCKRTGQSQDAHDIRTPPPGPVRHMRELLLDREVTKAYSDEEVLLRLRQVWGEFCALCWVFPHVDPQNPISFALLPAGQSLRCLGQVHDKIAEIQTGLWRVKHEERLRFDPTSLDDPDFARHHAIAVSRPIQLFGRDISICGDAELIAGACEFAGMLAALRWVVDDRWEWEAPGIMDVTLQVESQVPVDISIRATSPGSIAGH